eukprot:11363975-Karenia_brevis.AAC.1
MVSLLSAVQLPAAKCAEGGGIIISKTTTGVAPPPATPLEGLGIRGLAQVAHDLVWLFLRVVV